MGRVTKRAATTTWDSAHHAALYQKGFRELHWDPLETSGPAIKLIIEQAIAADADFEGLRWLFSTKLGGEKDSNNNLYYHYKSEASEYITQLARIGIRSRCHHIAACLFYPFFFSSSFSPVTSCILMMSATEKFLENGSVEGGRAPATRGVAAASGTYQEDDDSDESDSDKSDEEDDKSDCDSDDDTTTSMPTKPKGATPRKKVPVLAAAAAAVKSEKSIPKKGELELFFAQFEKASIRSDGHMGFDFSTKYPHYWFRYPYNGCNYIQYEMLLPTTHHDDFKAIVSNDGKHLLVNTAIPNSLLDPRIWQQRYAIADANLGDHILYQHGLSAVAYAREHIGDDGVNPCMAISLPFQCQQELNDPYDYDPNRKGNGTYFNYYPHPRYPRKARPDLDTAGGATLAELREYIVHLESNYHQVCIASITLKSMEVPKAPRGVTGQANPILF
jgi:hypothetical protein